MAGGKDFMARTTFALALLPSNVSRNPLPCTEVPMFLRTCVCSYVTITYLREQAVHRYILYELHDLCTRPVTL